MTAGLDSFMPLVIPARWVQLPNPDPVQRLHPFMESVTFRNGVDGVKCIVSLEDRQDDGVWLHVSVSRLHDLKEPTWRELRVVKDLFIGDEVCVQILPKKKDYLNVHPGTLHLFRRVDGDTLTAEVWDKA